MLFNLNTTDQQARSGTLSLHGQEIETPIFMPVGTAATVKGLTVSELKEIGYKLILSNTYHLFLRPGDELIKNIGGLHKFMNWDRAVLTDSGGFQFFSLKNLNKFTEEGVHFQSHIDGQKLFFSPEKAIQIQENLGSDIMMVLDECLELPADKKRIQKSIQLSYRWAVRCLEEKKRKDNFLFCINQGGDHIDLRKECAKQLREHDFDGFAIGGLSVGESKEIMYDITYATAPELPKEKPRYLMGVGDPVDIVHAVDAGIDMFDCVLPTRNARNGSLLTFNGPISIKQNRYKEDPRPLDENCACDTCQNYSRAYLRHLYQSKEVLSVRLNTYHNLFFMHELMSKIRASIKEGTFQEFKKTFLDRYQNKE